MKIIAIKQIKSSKNIHFITDEYNECNLDKILQLGEQGVIVILKSFCALIAVFFLLLALIGSKEWILHMFIEKNGKAWLDWFIYFGF